MHRRGCCCCCCCCCFPHQQRTNEQRLPSSSLRCMDYLWVEKRRRTEASFDSLRGCSEAVPRLWGRLRQTNDNFFYSEEKDLEQKIFFHGFTIRERGRRLIDNLFLPITKDSRSIVWKMGCPKGGWWLIVRWKRAESFLTFWMRLEWVLGG